MTFPFSYLAPSSRERKQQWPAVGTGNPGAQKDNFSPRAAARFWYDAIFVDFSQVIPRSSSSSSSSLPSIVIATRVSVIRLACHVRVCAVPVRTLATTLRSVSPH